MSSVQFVIKAEDIEKIENEIGKIGLRSEAWINKYLKEHASKETEQSIKSLMPVSDRNKTHAKLSNSLETTFTNLGFKTSTKNKYNYLYFPDQGAGTSKKHAPQLFFYNGLDRKYESIISGMLAYLEEHWKGSN